MAHIHPCRPAWDTSKGYYILLVQPPVNDSFRSHPTTQKICVKRHSSLILYPFYVRKPRARMAFHTPLQLHQLNRTALPSPQQEEHTFLRGARETARLFGQNQSHRCEPARGQPLPSCQVPRFTGVSWLLGGAELGSRAGEQPNPAWLDPGVQESRGESQQGRVTSPEASCGNSLLRGCDLIRFLQRSAPCMNYSVSLFYFPRGTDDAPALSGEAVTVVSSCFKE